MRAYSRSRGFNFIEVMVVVFIIAILAAFAAPAMTQLIRTQKVRTSAYDLFADLTYARGEAIARGHNVIVISAAGVNWQTGWLVRDTTANETLRLQGPRSTGIAFTADATSLTFDRNGRTTAVKFSIAPVESAPDDQKRCVQIRPSGQPHSATGVCP